MDTGTITWVRRHQLLPEHLGLSADIEYAGYYIHSCIKMRYKATFHPTYVLDPETYNWDPLDEDFKARLSAQKYVSLSRERRLEHQIEEEDINTGSIDNNLSPSTEPDDEATSISDPSSLFNVDMPGIPSVDQLISQTSVHDIRYRLQGAAGILGVGFSTKNIIPIPLLTLARRMSYPNGIQSR
jgi:hypothetical protein